MSRLKLGRSLGVIVAVLFLPLMARLVAMLIAWVAGCEAAAEATAACLLGGTDWSGVIGGLAALGWLALFSMPLAGGLVLLAVLQMRGHGRC